MTNLWNSDFFHIFELFWENQGEAWYSLPALYADITTALKVIRILVLFSGIIWWHKRRSLIQNVCFHLVLSQNHASEFLVRKRRANSFMEESKKGNMERECIEEYCNREEAREIFENNPETVRALWPMVFYFSKIKIILAEKSSSFCPNHGTHLPW